MSNYKFKTLSGAPAKAPEYKYPFEEKLSLAYERYHEAIEDVKMAHLHGDRIDREDAVAKADEAHGWILDLERGIPCPEL